MKILINRMYPEFFRIFGNLLNFYLAPIGQVKHFSCFTGNFYDFRIRRGCNQAQDMVTGRNPGPL